MDAIERFAADVAHEIKNPLSSIRSAIETLRRIEDPARQRQLLTIIAEDVMRLDRLISDVSDASRLDAELSRVSVEAVDVVPILRTLQELDEATRDDDKDPQAGGRCPAKWTRGPGGRGSAGAGAAQPDRQRAILQSAGRTHYRAGAGGRTAWPNCRVEDDGPGHSRCQSRAYFRPVLLGTSERREFRPAFRPWACRSAARSSRRCAARFPPRTAATAAATCWARASSSGCRAA